MSKKNEGLLFRKCEIFYTEWLVCLTNLLITLGQKLSIVLNFNNNPWWWTGRLMPELTSFRQFFCVATTLDISPIYFHSTGNSWFRSKVIVQLIFRYLCFSIIIKCYDSLKKILDLLIQHLDLAKKYLFHSFIQRFSFFFFKNVTWKWWSLDWVSF